MPASHDAGSHLADAGAPITLNFGRSMAAAPITVEQDNGGDCRDRPKDDIRDDKRRRAQCGYRCRLFNRLHARPWFLSHRLCIQAMMNVATSTANTIARKIPPDILLPNSHGYRAAAPWTSVLWGLSIAGASLCAESSRPQNRHTTAPGMISSLQKGHGCRWSGGGAFGCAETAQTMAATQPRSVHPKSRLSTKIAPVFLWLRSDAIENGNK